MMAFMHYGSIEISGGTVDINAKRIGLYIEGSASSSQRTGLKITGGKVSFYGGMTGAYVGWIGARDVYIDITGTVDCKNSSIGIYVNNGNLTIVKGNLISAAGKRFYAISPDNTNCVVNIAPADYTKVNQAISKIPADLSNYTEASVKAVNDAKQAVVSDKNIIEQNIVNQYATAIENAIAALKYKPADYTKVDNAISKIPTDLSLYTDSSVKKLKSAKQAINRNKNILEQDIVDGYATTIENAIAALKYKPADYTKVDNAIAKIPTDLSNYTEASVKAVDDAKQAVVNNKNITEQNIVNQYATAIENAIKALKYKPADYTKVNNAIAKIPSNFNLYTDTSVKVLNDAKQAVDLEKNILEQEIVDKYAESIESAIVALKYKPADYTKVKEAISKIPVNLNLYTEESVKILNDAQNAVTEGKDISEQEVVDEYAIIIENAIKALKYKSEEKTIEKIPTETNKYTSAETVTTTKIDEKINDPKDENTKPNDDNNQNNNSNINKDENKNENKNENNTLETNTTKSENNVAIIVIISVIILGAGIAIFFVIRRNK